MYTYRRRSTLPQKAQQITALHQFHNNVQRIHVKAYANQPQNVFMLEITHQLRLLQKFTLLLFGGAFSQRFYRHPCIGLVHPIHNTFVHLTECTAAQKAGHRYLIASNLWQQSYVRIGQRPMAVQQVIVNEITAAWHFTQVGQLYVRNTGRRFVKQFFVRHTATKYYERMVDQKMKDIDGCCQKLTTQNTATQHKN